MGTNPMSALGSKKGGIMGNTSPTYKGGQMQSMQYSPNKKMEALTGRFNTGKGYAGEMQNRAIKQAQKYDVPLYGKGGNVLWSPEGWKDPNAPAQDPMTAQDPMAQAVAPQQTQFNPYEYLGMSGKPQSNIYNPFAGSVN